MSNRLNGKTAIVTGAASGMGKAIALLFLKEGANVLAADLNESRLLELDKEVSDLGLSEHYLSALCNITKNDDCDRVIKLCTEKFGSFNLLSHNAGIADNFALLEEIEDEAWDRLISVNLTGSMKITRAAVRYFVENEIKGNIVMVTSNAAFESATGGPAYCASKAGANALMKSIAFEYGRKGIRCNSICPGPVMTNIVESQGTRSEAGAKVHHASGYNAHYREWACRPIGFPEDIANMAIYLASDESSFVNGASMLIDAGVCLG